MVATSLLHSLTNTVSPGSNLLVKIGWSL